MNSTEGPQKSHLTVGEVERMLGMDRRTIDKAGIPHWFTPGGHRRYHIWDVRTYIREHQKREER